MIQTHRDEIEIVRPHCIVPLQHIRVVLKSVKEKLRVCTALGVFLDDVAEVYYGIGKNLSKAGSQPVSGKGAWFPALSTVVDHIQKVPATQSKQYLSLHATIERSIAKSFGDVVKTNSRRLDHISSEVTKFCGAYKKSKLKHQKSYNTYAKLVQEIELCIKSKHASLEDPVERDGGVMGKMKMFAKMTTEDSQKRYSDRIRDMIQSMDIYESQLTNHGIQLVQFQSYFKTQCQKALDDVYNVERNRLSFLQDFLSRLHVAQDLMLERSGEFITTLTLQLGAFTSKEEIATILWAVDQAEEQAVCVSSDLEVKEEHASSDLFPRLAKLVEALEYLKSLLKKTHGCFSEIADVHRMGRKSILKILEKQGFGMLSQSMSRTMGVNLSHGDKCYEVLISHESPSMQVSWTTALSSFQEAAEIHLQLSVELDSICRPLNASVDVLNRTRIELMERKAAHEKNIDAAEQNVAKMTQKLVKQQALLVERKDTLSKAKDEIIAPAEYQPSSEGDPSNVFDEVGTGMSRGKSMMKHVRAGKLSVAMGLESRSDRINRIEKQIVLLSEEEGEIQGAVDAAATAAELAHNCARKEILNALNASKEIMCNIIVQLETHFFPVFLSQQRNYLERMKATIQAVKDSCSSIDVEADLLSHFGHFSTLEDAIVPEILSAATLLGSSDSNTNLCMSDLIAPLSRFVPTRPGIISEERSTLGMPPALTLAALEEAAQSLPLQVAVDDVDTDDKVVGDLTENVLASVSLDIVQTQVEPISMESAIPMAQTESVVGLDQALPSPSKDLRSPSQSPHATFQSVKEMKEDPELSKFGLSASVDKILESFSCALMSKSTLVGLVHGKMIITQNFVAFQGWPDSRVLLPLVRLSRIEKMNTLYYIPNAILLCDGADNQEYFFSSFIDRDPCFSLLTRMCEVSKRLVEMHGRDIALDNRTLIFGLQKDGMSDMFFTSSSEAQAAAAAAVAVMGAGVGEPDAASVRSPMHPLSSKGGAPALANAGDLNIHDWNWISPNAPDEVADVTIDKSSAKGCSTGSNSTSPPSSSSLAVPVTASNAAKPFSATQRSDLEDEPNDWVDMSSLFSKMKIDSLANDAIAFPAADHFSACWLHGCAFSEFLKAEGDIDIKFGEWKSFSGPVAEDISKLKFTFARNFSYAHPRTDPMQRFGPKTAPATQMQYLYVFGRGCSTLAASSILDSLKSAQPRRGLVLTVTQFDGIPMADCFKVLQYWGFEENVSHPTNCLIRLGMHVHFTKFTMFKGQVSSGVKEELTVLAKKWIEFAKSQMRLQSAKEMNVLSDVVQVTPVDNTELAPPLSKKYGSNDVESSETIQSQVQQTVVISEKVHRKSAAETFFRGNMTVIVVLLLLSTIMLQWWEMKRLREEIRANRFAVEGFDSKLATLQALFLEQTRS